MAPTTMIPIVAVATRLGATILFVDWVAIVALHSGGSIEECDISVEDYALPLNSSGSFLKSSVDL